MSANLNKILHKTSFRNKKIMKPMFWIALTIGLNIKKETEFKDPVKLVSLAFVLLSVFTVSTQYLFIWEHRIQTFTVYTDAICTSIQIWLAITIMIYFSLTQHKFQKIIQKVQNSEILQNFEFLDLNILNRKQITEEIQTILDNSWLDIKRQLTIFISAASCTLFWYYFSCLKVNFYNTYIEPKEFEILFPGQTYFPFWRNKAFPSIYYFIQYLISSSGCHVSGFTIVSVTCLFFISTLHALALVKILRRLIDNSTTENVRPEDRMKFTLAWCRLYQRIYEYYKEINSLYYILSAPLFLANMLIICLLIFQSNAGLGTDLNMAVRAFLYLATIFFQVFMFCINGHRLTSECEELSAAIYKTKWYDESNEFRVIIRMMIMRTNRIFVMEVAGFTIMSRVTFLAIMRGSFSYFLLLRDVNDG